MENLLINVEIIRIEPKSERRDSNPHGPRIPNAVAYQLAHFPKLTLFITNTIYQSDQC